MIISLRLGPLGGGALLVRRSGMHWLREDGALCRPGEVVAYCDLSVEPARFPGLAAQPFAGERTLQVALAPRVAGRLRIDPSSSAGGLLDTLGVYGWSAGDVIATLEASPADLAEAGLEAETFRLLMLAGRRMTWIVDVAAGLLPGWNSRARAWWADGDEPGPTLLCLGVCDASGIIRGDLSGFVEMFEATPFPAQMAHVNEHPLVPCAPYLLEQFLRTPAQYEAIAADITRALQGRSDLDLALIPAETINDSGLFLDDASLDAVRATLSVPVEPSYDFIDVMCAADMLPAVLEAR